MTIREAYEAIAKADLRRHGIGAAQADQRWANEQTLRDTLARWSALDVPHVQAWLFGARTALLLLGRTDLLSSDDRLDDEVTP